MSTSMDRVIKIESGELSYLEPGRYQYVCQDHLKTLPARVLCAGCKRDATFTLQRNVLVCERGHALLVFVEEP